MYDIFLKDVDICNFDDTTTYISNKSLENVLKSLEKSSMLAIDSAKWRAQRAHVPYVLYVAYVPPWPTCSTCPRCPHALCALRADVPKYILQTRKLKMETLFPSVFKGTGFSFGP